MLFPFPGYSSSNSWGSCQDNLLRISSGKTPVDYPRNAIWCVFFRNSCWRFYQKVLLGFLRTFFKKFLQEVLLGITPEVSGNLEGFLLRDFLLLLQIFLLGILPRSPSGNFSENSIWVLLQIPKLSSDVISTIESEICPRFLLGIISRRRRKIRNFWRI